MPFYPSYLRKNNWVCFAFQFWKVIVSLMELAPTSRYTSKACSLTSRFPKTPPSLSGPLLFLCLTLLQDNYALHLYFLWHECNLNVNMTVWFIVTTWKYCLIMLKYRCKVQHTETKTVFDRLIWKNNILSVWHFLKCSCCINNLIPNNLFHSYFSLDYNIGVMCVVILISKCNCHFLMNNR